MPPREARGLFLHREYFTDSEFQTSLTPNDREVYIGLCQLADDAGWLEWRRLDVVGYLNRYGNRAETELDSAFEALKRTKRLRILVCGHAQLPKWGTRRHIGRPDGQSFAVRDAHEIERGRKLPGKKSDISRKRREASVAPTLPLHYTTLNPTNGRAPARGRGGAPKSAKEMLADFGYNPLSKQAGKAHD